MENEIGILIRNPPDLEEVVLPLFAVTGDGKWHAIGTAFVIAVLDEKRALLMSAAHNLRAIQRMDGQPRHHPSTPPEFLPPQERTVDFRSTRVFAMLKTPSGLLPLEAPTSWFFTGLDAALIFVTIRPEQDGSFKKQLALDTQPIEVATPVLAIGYPGMFATSNPDYDRNIFEAQINLKLESRLGKVVELQPQGVTIHRWPGFLVDCPLDSGMSGGPVVAVSDGVPIVRGFVGGDIGESAVTVTSGSGAHAFASLLWPTMVIELHGTSWDIALPHQTPHLLDDATLLDLVRAGIVDDRGRAHDHVRFERLPDGSLTGIWQG